MLLIWWLAETTAIGLILASLATLASRCRKLGPAMRHGLWLVVLMRLVMPPVLSWPALPANWSINPEPIARAADSLPVAPAEPMLPDSASIDPESASTEQASVYTTASAVDRLIDVREPDTVSGWNRANVLWMGLGAWIAGSAIWGAVQVFRIARFARGLRETEAPPEWMSDELMDLAERLGVRAPALLVTSRLDPPLLWCLSRPSLVLPESLLKSLDVERWRAILAHELAHLRRGDHWVGRALLLAGLFWWWNPLYWWVRSRLEAEAELACDAWVVSALPQSRRVYASALIDVCESVSRARVTAPAMGVGGASGRFLERRITMILLERASCRISAGGLLTLGCLALVAAPSWTFAQEGSEKQEAAVEAKILAEKKEQESAAHRNAEAELKRAQERLSRLTEDLEKQRARAENQVKEAQARMLETQKRLKDQLVKSQSQFEEAQARLKQLLSAREQSAESAERSPKEREQALLQKRRAYDQEHKSAQERSHAELAKALAELSKLQGSDREKVQAHMAELKQKLARDAESHWAELKQKLAREAEARHDVNEKRGQESKANLERRVAGLEDKLNAVLAELKALRAERRGSEGEGGARR
jgi:beta-lactamase regulating signal transducer with metallopeptidase domain